MKSPAEDSEASSGLSPSPGGSEDGSENEMAHDSEDANDHAEEDHENGSMDGNNDGKEEEEEKKNEIRSKSTGKGKNNTSKNASSKTEKNGKSPKNASKNVDDAEVSDDSDDSDEDNAEMKEDSGKESDDEIGNDAKIKKKKTTNDVKKSRKHKKEDSGDEDDNANLTESGKMEKAKKKTDGEKKGKIIIKMKNNEGSENPDVAALMEGLSDDDDDDDDDGDNDDDNENGGDDGDERSKNGSRKKGSKAGNDDDEDDEDDEDDDGSKKKRRRKKGESRGKRSFEDLITKILYEHRRSVKGVTTQQLKKEMLNKYGCGSARFMQHFQLAVSRMHKEHKLLKLSHRFKLDKKYQAKLHNAELKRERERKDADLKRRLKTGDVTIDELQTIHRKEEAEKQRKEEARKKAQERRDAKAKERAKKEEAEGKTKPKNKAKTKGDKKDKKPKSDKKEKSTEKKKKKTYTPGLPKPPLPVIDLPYDAAVLQDLMAIVEFCCEFSHIVKLTPFSAEMLYKALNDTEVTPLLRELHLVFLGLCLEPEMNQDEKVVRWDWFKMLNSLTWQEILRRYLIRSTALLGPEWPPYEELVSAQKHLQNESYVTLSVVQKVAIIRALIDEVQSHPEIVEEVDRLTKELLARSTKLYHMDMAVRRQINLVQKHQALLEQGKDAPYNEDFNALGEANSNAAAASSSRRGKKKAPEPEETSDVEDGENDDDNHDDDQDSTSGGKGKGGKASAASKARGGRKWKKMKTLEDLEKVSEPISGAKLKARKAYFEQRAKELAKMKDDLVLDFGVDKFANFRLRAEAWGKDAKGNAYWTFRSDPGRLWIYGPGVRGERHAREKALGIKTPKHSDSSKEDKSKSSQSSKVNLAIPTVDTKVETVQENIHEAEGAAVVPGASPTSREALKRWRFYDTVDQFDGFLVSLDPMYNRERHLKETLTDFRRFVTYNMVTEAEREAAAKKAAEEETKREEEARQREQEQNASGEDQNDVPKKEADGTPIEVEEVMDFAAFRPRPKRNAAKQAEEQMRQSGRSAKKPAAVDPEPPKETKKKREKTWKDTDPDAYKKYRNLMNHVNGRELDLNKPDPEDNFLDDFDLKLFKDAERPVITARVLKKDLGELANFIEAHGGKFELENGKEDFVKEADAVLGAWAKEDSTKSEVEKSTKMEEQKADNSNHMEIDTTLNSDGEKNGKVGVSAPESVLFDTKARAGLEKICITLEQAATEAVIATKKQQIIDEAERIRQQKFEEELEKEREAQRVAMQEARKRRNDERRRAASVKRRRDLALRSGRNTRSAASARKTRKRTKRDEIPEATLSGRIVRRVNYREGASEDGSDSDSEGDEDVVYRHMEEEDDDDEEDIRADEVDDEEDENDEEKELEDSDKEDEKELKEAVKKKMAKAEAEAEAAAAAATTTTSVEEETKVDVQEDIDIEVSGAEAERIQMMIKLETKFPVGLRVRCDLEPQDQVKSEDTKSVLSPSKGRYVSHMVNGKVKSFNPASYLSMDRVQDLWSIELENGKTITLDEKETKIAYVRYRRYERESNNVNEDDNEEEDDGVMHVENEENQEEKRRIRVLWGSKSERDAWLHTLQASETCSAWSSAIYQLANRIFVNNALSNNAEEDDSDDA